MLVSPAWTTSAFVHVPVPGSVILVRAAADLGHAFDRTKQVRERQDRNAHRRETKFAEAREGVDMLFAGGRSRARSIPMTRIAAAVHGGQIGIVEFAGWIGWQGVQLLCAESPAISLVFPGANDIKFHVCAPFRRVT